MNLKENTTLQSGKYRIIRVLGQGGFGITYLAEHTLLDKLVAIKEFFPKDFCGRAGDTSALHIYSPNQKELVDKLKRRFMKEAKNIAKLDHPGIIKIHDIFEENNTAYYVMDYVEGENLSQIVKRKGPIPTREAISYFKKIGEALSYVHSNKMTHFDVKPANIIINKKNSNPVLIDFGFSKQFDKNNEATSTLLQGVSHGFSAIEMYSTDLIDSFSPQTDVYSLGAILLFLLTGKVPPSASEIANRGLKIPSYVNTYCSNTIKRAMEVKQEKREMNIKNLIKVLDKNTDSKPRRSRKITENQKFLKHIFKYLSCLVGIGIIIGMFYFIYENKFSSIPSENQTINTNITFDTITNNRFLTTMANDHYGNAIFWGYIYMENDSILYHPDFIKSGTVLKIPELSRYNISPDNPEDIKKAMDLNYQIIKKFRTFINHPTNDTIVIPQ